MDRIFKYSKTIVLDTDFLSTSKNGMLGLGKLTSFLLNGTTTLAHGLNATQTTSPSLSITLAAGQIYSFVVVDATAYGSLAADTTHSVMKQAFNVDPVNVGPFTVPGTVGQSANHLVQAQYVETDSGSQVLPYYNSSNPTIPQSGPNNTGTSQPTVRGGTISLAIKAGTPVATGSQVTPAPDSGWIGLWVVTIAQGASTIVNANISAYNNSVSFFQGFVPFVGGTMLGTLALFAGSTVPTATPGDNTTKIINSAFLVNALTPYALLAGPTFTGDPKAPTPAPGDNDTSIATTAFVAASFAPLASPTFTGTPAAPTPAQFDSSTKIATTAFLTAMGVQFSKVTNFNNAGGTLAASAVGGIVSFTGTTTFAVTAPTVASVPVGAVLLIQNQNSAAGNCTIQRASTDTMTFGDGVSRTSITLQQGDWLLMVAQGSGVWEVFGSPGINFGGTFQALFASTQATNGHFILPSGVIIQWGTLSIAGSTSAAFSFPFAFPTNCYALVVTNANTSSGGSGSTNGSITSRLAGTIGNNNTLTSNVFFIAIGN